LGREPEGSCRSIRPMRRASKHRPSGASAGLQYCSPGVADIVAWPGPGETLCVECKRPPSGRQSEAQKAFERFVTGIGHAYLIATSVEEVHAFISS
jgi:hypothetical protein